MSASLTDASWKPWPGYLEPSTTAVVRYFITSADQSFLSTLLLPAEQKRAERFRQLADKQRFVAGRGWIRWLSGQLMGTSPNLIQVVTGPFGKPAVINPDPPLVNWHVNISHAGEWVLLAISPAAVGVDVEWIHPDWPYQDLIPSTFDATDQARLAISDDARTLFYTLWTRKESLLKAAGQGLTDDFREISSSKGRYQVAGSGSVGLNTWQATSFSVSAGYVGAVAQQEPLTPIHFFTIDTAIIGPTT